MDKSAKKEALEMTEQIMKLSLYYCKDEDDEIAAYSIRVNSEAHKLKKLIERYLTDRTDN
tara:strand:- start:2164 stop:2343 length:180 start_codon:yes stop_codon:yes gene_type:complete